MDQGFLRELSPRACPVCGSTDDSRVFADARFDAGSLDGYAFASRKRPEYMRLRLVSCPGCDLVYASHVPDPDALARAYEDAAFDSGVEARFAARTYIDALGPLIGTLPDRAGAFDIGTGDGAFLLELLESGFTGVGGVEPSSTPIATADDRIAGLIEQGVFKPGMRAAGDLSLVTCFQTIEHVPDPAALVREAAGLLKPGGILAIVCHDRRAPINRLLGLRSPIIDIEHQQLFSPESVSQLLDRAGLVDIGHRVIHNRYPLRYWLRLLPLPRPARALAERLLVGGRAGDWAVTLPVGNLLAWGRLSEDGAGSGANRRAA
jgi:SAM-dependent methyltransferase